MQINIHELQMKSEVTFSGTQTVHLRRTNMYRPDETYTAQLEGKVNKIGRIYIVRAHVKAIVKLLCDRCLEEFDYPVEADIRQGYSLAPTESADDEEIIEMSGSTIDLEDVVTEAIYLNLPMHWVHDEDCKGICTVCGQNLNKHTCKCEQHDIDPRLEVLKNIFHPQSEE